MTNEELIRITKDSLKKKNNFADKTLEPVSLVRFTSWFFSHWDAGIDILEGLDEQGVWSKVILLPKGRYEYFILIDQKK